jgi:hypothetical protein
MNNRQPPSEATRQLENLARRLGDNPEYMSFVLATYVKQEKLTDEDLAARLDSTPAMIARLKLCKRPNSKSAQFSNHVRQIAAYTNTDVARLANILRQIDSLEQLSQQPKVAGSKAADAEQMPLRSGLLAAARDREEEAEEDKSSRGNEDDEKRTQ